MYKVYGVMVIEMGFPVLHDESLESVNGIRRCAGKVRDAEFAYSSHSGDSVCQWQLMGR